MIKKCSNPTSAISDETIAHPNAQIVGDDMVRVQVPRCMAWLDYDEHEDSLNTMDNEVGVTSPQNTIQTLPSFEEYTTPVTYPEELEETLRIPMEVEPLDEPLLVDLGLNTCNHDIALSYKEIPSVDEPEPQLLPNSSPLDVILGDKRGTDPPINPCILGSFWKKVVDPLTINTPPSPHVAYYHSGLGEPKKHYGFKPGLLGQSGSLGVDLLNLETIEDDWELGFKEVSFLGRGFSSPVKPKEVEKVKIKDSHHSEHIIQQPIFQRVTPSHHNGVYCYYHPHLNSSVREPSPLSVK
ncbi:hypothetical protein Tco_1064912 [Tanacetum coccineum]